MLTFFSQSCDFLIPFFLSFSLYRTLPRDCFSQAAFFGWLPPLQIPLSDLPTFLPDPAGDRGDPTGIFLVVVFFFFMIFFFFLTMKTEFSPSPCQSHSPVDNLGR